MRQLCRGSSLASRYQFLHDKGRQFKRIRTLFCDKFIDMVAKFDMLRQIASMPLLRERRRGENMDKEINDKEKDGAKPTTLECKPPVFFATIEEVRKYEAARASKRAQDGENDINVDGSDNI